MNRTDLPESAPSTMIELDCLTKLYPGQHEPAVDNLSLAIPEGEIVILVGPSGCGKTTTMKMINRIIEPTSGRIVLEGQDVTSTDPNMLRRRIGYVIQQVGLFPHMTIAENIATVPKLLGWDRKRIEARVDELLEMINMPAARYRNRYPKDLSGGQLQRVGVARALSGDPEVMLMDEPFGAIDPITRERLQNEFLRLQSAVRKTIVFVTHDIDEAIKMGDRIAVLDEHSRLAQYGTPQEILSAPANEFVAGFVGSGASLKRLTLTRISEIEMASCPTFTPVTTNDQVRSLVDRSSCPWALRLHDDGRPERWIRTAEVARSNGGGRLGLGEPVDAVVTREATLSDALNQLVTSITGMVVVVDDRGRYCGIVDLDVISRVSRGEAAAGTLSDVQVTPSEVAQP